MGRRATSTICLFWICTFAANAQAIRFITNEGQWPDQVTHRAELAGTTLWMERNGVTIDRYDASAIADAHANQNIDPGSRPIILRGHVVKLRFLSAVSPSVRGEQALPGAYHYFLGDSTANWAGHAKAYAAVRVTGIAPGCDALFREGRSGLKYDLIIRPGSDPLGIRFDYEGADEVTLRDGALVVTTSMGRMTERIPMAYQDIHGERRIIPCTYWSDAGEIGIRPGPYDPEHELVIDPELSFATYSGSFSNNFGYTATFDAAGFLYAGSTAFGPLYPTTTGAYSTDWSGGTTDIAITKYDTTGTQLIWSTYLGGSAAEMPHSLYVDNNDQLLLLGTTASPDIPVTSNAFDPTFAGGTPFTPSGLGLSYPNGSDMLLARLSADGSALLGCTYLGGTGNDGLNSAPGLKFNYADEVRGEVLLATNGDVWVTSCTQSTNMPVTTDAAQAGYAGGSHDGYVARFNADLSTLIYASYIGGSAADAVYNGVIGTDGSLLVCGGSTSTDLATSADAVQQTTNGGSAEAFVARFAASGNTIDALTYWGSSAYDQAYFVELDGNGAVYVFGQTSAPSGQLILNAPYNQPSGGQFITKFSADLSSALLSSRVGRNDGNPDISPTAFLVDVCDKIYTSGWGSSNAGLGGSLTTQDLPITPDAHQSSTDGHDLYLAVFDIDMTALTYATYYGGGVSPEHVDGGTSRFDRRGRVYQSVCAGCQNNDDFPTTPNAWSATNNSTGCNNGVLKFDFDAPLVIAAFLAPERACAEEPFTFINLSSGAAGVVWDFGDGSAPSTVVNPTHAYALPGTYTVVLTATNPLACNESDQTTRTIVVAPARPQLMAMPDTLLCGPINTFELVANSFGTASSFHWSSTSDLSDRLNPDPTDSTATLSPLQGGSFFVSATVEGGCAALDSTTIILSLADITMTDDLGICLGDTALITVNGADPGSTFLWSPDDLVLSGQGTAGIQVAPAENTAFGVSVVAPSGCAWNATVQVDVSTITGASVSASVDQALVLPGTTVQLSATPSGDLSYAWTPVTGVSDPSSPIPTAVVNSTTTFVVNVSDGVCSKDASVQVTVFELRCSDPDIFVPNTFTPNDDGVNDLLLVRGRHVERLEFLVFDRWGELVFSTTDQRIGWDGTYQGRPVDPAVFVYHLTVDCVDGQRYFTKGNVTVVR